MIMVFIISLILIGLFSFIKINKQRNINALFLSTLEYFRKNPRELFSEFTNQEYFELAQLPDIVLQANIFDAIITGMTISTNYSKNEIIEITSRNSTVFLIANQEIEMIIENMRKQADKYKYLN